MSRSSPKGMYGLMGLWCRGSLKQPTHNRPSPSNNGTLVHARVSRRVGSWFEPGAPAACISTTIPKSDWGGHLCDSDIVGIHFCYLMSVMPELYSADQNNTLTIACCYNTKVRMISWNAKSSLISTVFWCCICQWFICTLHNTDLHISHTKSQCTLGQAGVPQWQRYRHWQWSCGWQQALYTPWAEQMAPPICWTGYEVLPATALHWCWDPDSAQSHRRSQSRHWNTKEKFHIGHWLFRCWWTETDLGYSKSWKRVSSKCTGILSTKRDLTRGKTKSISE